MLVKCNRITRLKSEGDVGLVWRAVIYSGWIRFLLLFLPFRWYESSLGKRRLSIPEKKLGALQEKKLLRIQQITYSVSKYTPWESKCLVKALSAKWLLARYGVSSTLYFGIQNQDGGEKGKGLLAHAWLKVGDRFITGRKGHKRYLVVNFYS